MNLASLPNSIFDEFTFGDSSARSSIFRIQVGSTSYGSFAATDSKDYFQIATGIGSYSLYVTADPANGFVTSQAGANFNVAITDSAGNVITQLPSSVGADAFTRSISFALNADVTIYVEISNPLSGTFSYAATLATTPDTTAPIVSSFGPTDEATGVGVFANIVLTFNEAIQRGTGDIVLKDTAGTVIETLSAASSGNLFINGSTLTIDPASTLQFGTGYKIEFAAGSVKDIAGNAYAGTTTYNFTTASTADTTPPVAPKLVTNTAFNFVIDPQVTLQSSMGTVVIELNPEHAPVTVANMLAYVNSGYYGGTLFHRVIPGFMAQGGGFTAGMVDKPSTYAPITLESNNGLPNLRGSIAMARTTVPDSATSEFFINVVDNGFLNYSSSTSSGYGYAVFGKVLSGMPVIDSIVAVPRTLSGSPLDVPLTDITITSLQQTVAGSSFTNAATFTVAALEAGAQWSYSLDAGATWNAGRGTSFVVPVGSYAANAIQVRQSDAAGNLSAATGKFSSALVVDTTAPTVTGASPVDEGTGFAADANIVINFSETIAKGAGVILLKDAGGAVIESFEAGSSSRLTLSGSTLTIDPSSDLAYNSAYKLDISAGALRDLAGNIYGGTTVYNFTTGAHINRLPGGAVTITGTATQGQTLTAVNFLADADGLGTFNYQWSVDGAPISGATATSFTLTQAHVGKTISVKASYTDGWGIAESVNSIATAAVANVNDAPTAGVQGNRIIGVNEVLSLNPGMLFNDIDGDALSFGASGLPAGLAINSSTGEISGTVNAAGSHHITVTGTDSGGLSASLAFDLAIASGPYFVTRSGVPLPGATTQDLVVATPPGTFHTFSRGTADFLINGTTKPVTAADALDALKLSVGLNASQGTSWKELIAADMTRDGRVTAADALEILKTSVGINTIQPSWVFVPTDLAFNSGLGGMTRLTVTYADKIDISAITSSTSSSVTGILVGDVNNSWVIPT